MYVGQSHAVILVMLHVQHKCDNVKSMSCQHEVNNDDVMPMWCSCNVNTNDVMPCQPYMVGMECEP